MLNSAELLKGIPDGLRTPLLTEYDGIVTAFAEGRWKMASLDAGRFCEIVYTILDGALNSGQFAAVPTKPERFVNACRSLEQRPRIPVGDHSLRILIPRVLPAVYDIRNNRDVGHVGGDVLSNEMDASFVRETASWILSELVRVFHGVSPRQAQAAVDALAERKHPLVWERDGIRRVLDPEMSASDRTLVLLYGQAEWCPAAQLQLWVKYKKNFRAQVLAPMAGDLLIEVDDADRVMLTPRGARRVEEVIRLRV